MKLTYDPIRNIAYLALLAKSAKVDTIRVGDELNIDIAPHGTVYGIELLNANAQLRSEKDGSLVTVETLEAGLSPAKAIKEKASIYSTKKRRKR